MTNALVLWLCLTSLAAPADEPLLPSPVGVAPATDWLLQREPFPATLTASGDGRLLVLENGLVRRAWLLDDGALGCVALDDLRSGASLQIGRASCRERV